MQFVKSCRVKTWCAQIRRSRSSIAKFKSAQFCRSRWSLPNIFLPVAKVANRHCRRRIFLKADAQCSHAHRRTHARHGGSARIRVDWGVSGVIGPRPQIARKSLRKVHCESTAKERLERATQRRTERRYHHNCCCCSRHMERTPPQEDSSYGNVRTGNYFFLKCS